MNVSDSGGQVQRSPCLVVLSITRHQHTPATCQPGGACLFLWPLPVLQVQEPDCKPAPLNLPFCLLAAPQGPGLNTAWPLEVSSLLARQGLWWPGAGGQSHRLQVSPSQMSHFIFITGTKRNKKANETQPLASTGLASLSIPVSLSVPNSSHSACFSLPGPV